MRKLVPHSNEITLWCIHVEWNRFRPVESFCILRTRQSIYWRFSHFFVFVHMSFDGMSKEFSEPFVSPCTDESGVCVVLATLIICIVRTVRLGNSHGAQRWACHHAIHKSQHFKHRAQRMEIGGTVTLTLMAMTTSVNWKLFFNYSLLFINQREAWIWSAARTKLDDRKNVLLFSSSFSGSAFYLDARFEPSNWLDTFRQQQVMRKQAKKRVRERAKEKRSENILLRLRGNQCDVFMDVNL